MNFTFSDYLNVIISLFIFFKNRKIHRIQSHLFALLRYRQPWDAFIHMHTPQMGLMLKLWEGVRSFTPIPWSALIMLILCRFAFFFDVRYIFRNGTIPVTLCASAIDHFMITVFVAIEIVCAFRTQGFHFGSCSIE